MMKGTPCSILLAVGAPERRAALREQFGAMDFLKSTLTEVSTLEAAREALRGGCGYDVCLLDAALDGADGRTLLALAREAECLGATLVLLDEADPRLEIQLLRLGAADVLAWNTVEAEPLERAVQHALARRQAQQDRLRSSDTFRVLIEHAQDVITVVGSDGTIRYTSPAVKRVMGYDSTELIGESAFAYIHEEDRQTVAESIYRIVTEPGEVHRVAYRFLHKDGSFRILESVGSTSHDGDDVQIIVNSRDVTTRKRAEAALLQSETRLRNLTDTAVDAIISVDAEGHVFDWNQGAENIFGYSDAEMLGQSVSRIMPERYVPLHERGMKRFNTTGEGYIIGSTAEVHGLHRDGHEFPVEIALSHWEADGQRFFTAVLRDITARKQAEEALRKSEALNRALLDAMPDALLRLGHDGTFIGHKSPSGFDWFISPTEALGQRFEDVLPADLASRMNEARLRALETNEAQTVEYSIEVEGEVHFREARLVAYGEGEVVLVLRDFTAWKRAEQRLRERESQFRDLFENSPDAIFVEALDGTVLDVNPAGSRLHGSPRSELVGKNVRDLVPPGKRRRAMQYFEKMAAGNVDYLEGFSYTKDGRVIPIELRARRIEYGPRPALLLHVRDITERKQAEETLRHREAILGAAAFMAEKLLKTHRWQACIDEVLAHLGDATNVSRVYVFENHSGPDGSLFTSQRFEWTAPGITSFLDHPSMQNLPWQGGGFDRWYGLLSQGRAVLGTITALPPEEVAILEEQNVRSIIVVPIFLDEHWWGLIGFDDCAQERTWTDAEVGALRTVANMLGVAIQRAHVEEALRRSEMQNRAIVDALPDALTRLSRDGTYLEVRLPRGYKSFIDPQSLIGTSAYEQLPPSVAEPARQCLERALETGNLQSFEYEIEVNGERRVREGRVVPCGENEAISIQRDITERKRAEEEVQRLKAFYEQVLDDIPADIAVTDPEGRILYLNHSSVKDPEMREWLIGKTAFDYCRRRGLDMSLAENRQRYVAQAVAEKRSIRFEESLQSRRSGRVHHMLRIASPVIGADGEARQVIGYGLDITERKQAEEALRQSEALLRTVVSNLPVLLFVFDEHGVFKLAEGKGLEALGLDAGAVIGQSAFELNGAFGGVGQQLQRALDGEAFSATLEAEHFAFEYWYAPLTGTDERVVGAIAVAADITEIKRSEQELKRSQEQLRELAQHLQSVREAERTRISREVHDQLGQSLTALRMDVAWLEKRLEEQQDQLQQRLDAMKGLIDQTVRTVRRIATELRPGVLDDLGLAAALEWQTQEFAERTGLACAFTVETDLLDLDRNRSTAVFRVFQELLTNVARHAEAQRVDVWLRTEDGELILVVRDDGRGIEDLDTVHSNSLGMLGMRERTQAWGGGVAFQSTPGEGTEVTVRIPLPAMAEV